MDDRASVLKTEIERHDHQLQRLCELFVFDNSVPTIEVNNRRRNHNSKNNIKPRVVKSPRKAFMEWLDTILEKNEDMTKTMTVCTSLIPFIMIIL